MALGKLSPEDRAEFLKMLQQQAAARGVKLPGKVASDPTDLGKVLTDLHQKPGQLRDILGRWPASRRKPPGRARFIRHTEVPHRPRQCSRASLATRFRSRPNNAGSR